MKTSLLLGLFVLLPQMLWANLSCHELLLSPNDAVVLRRPSSRIRSFPQSQVYLPNLSRPIANQELTFVQWYELEYRELDQVQSVLGLTAEGKIYHVIHFGPGRTVARLLAGGRKYLHFFVSDQDHVLAITQSGKAYVYRADIWQSQSMTSGVRNRAISWGLLTTFSIGILSEFLFGPENQSFLTNLMTLQGYEFLGPILGTAVTGFALLSKYESTLFMDGFVPIDWPEEDQRPILRSVLENAGALTDFDISLAEHLNPGVVR